MRSPRFSGWSPTTWSETRCAAAGACPGKSCPPSPKPDNRIAHTAAGPAGWAELSALHSGNTQNPVASAVASDTRDTPAQWQNAPQTPPASAGSPPQPRMLYVGVSGVKCIPRSQDCKALARGSTAAGLCEPCATHFVEAPGLNGRRSLRALRYALRRSAGVKRPQVSASPALRTQFGCCPGLLPLRGWFAAKYCVGKLYQREYPGTRYLPYDMCCGNF